MNQPNYESQVQDAPAGNFLAQIPTVLRERKWWIIVPTVIGSIAALAAVLLIPPVYRSTAIMLVQSSQLSEAILGGQGNEEVDRRIARIREQATSRPDLVALIERHGLYPSMRKRKALSSVVEEMRSSISLNPTVSSPGAQNKEKTIAFELSFDYSEPAGAQTVAQDLMQRILELDASGNATQAENRVQFLTQQATDLEKKIQDVQGQISGVAAANGVALSGGNSMIGVNGASYDMQIASLQRDNAALVNQKSIIASSDTRDPIVAGAESQLAAAQATYADSHPDVIAAKQRLAEAKALAKKNIAKVPVNSIDSQIAFNNSQIAMLRSAKAREMAQASAMMSAQARAPQVQQQLSDLQSQLSALNDQYKAVSDRLLAAKAGERAENEQMGERLSVVEPPIVPEDPVEPNRLMLAGIGIGGGLALGLFLAFAIELLLRPIRGPGVLEAMPGTVLLGVVPWIDDAPERKARHPWWKLNFRRLVARS